MKHPTRPPFFQEERYYRRDKSMFLRRALAYIRGTPRVGTYSALARRYGISPQHARHHVLKFARRLRFGDAWLYRHRPGRLRMLLRFWLITERM